MAKQQYYYAKFKLYCNRLQSPIKLSKKSHYNDYFNTYNSDIKISGEALRQLVKTTEVETTKFSIKNHIS